ncbi:MAG: ATP-binding protein, partial [Spirochaetales bacterium]|nr:ATP-binding protein [Spirochaetales bacterium]
MSSERKTEKNRRSIKADLKFTIIFAGIFWIASIIVYAFVFIYIHNSLLQSSRAGLQVRMLGYWAIEQSGGLELLTDNIDVNMILSDEQPFFVRIADEFNNTLLLETPEHWSSFNFQQLERIQPRPGSFVQLRSGSMRYVLETGCIPLSDGNFLQVGTSDENRRRVLELLSGSFLVALLILVGISSASGFLVARRFLMPIRDLERTVNEVIETGRIESRITERKGVGELEGLIVSFNEMLEKIEELVHGMKGALDTVAHDLRTPLTRFRMISEKSLSRQDFASDAEAAEEYRYSLEQAVVESETVLRMMTLLMDISEAETGTLKLNKTEFRPADRLLELFDVYEMTAEDRGISFQLKQPLWQGLIYADSDRFRQAVGNLIDNALKYGKEGGQVIISLTADDSRLRVEVKDDGEGISGADLPEIWKRLYR